MSTKPRVLGVTVEHPTARERSMGRTRSRAHLMIDRRLKTGKLDEVPLDEDDLVRLIAQASQVLAILRRVRT